MHKILISFFSLLAIFTADGLARPFKCQFRSTGKCTDLSYFQTQVKDGCATPGSKCSVAFCTHYCARIIKGEAHNMNKFGTNVVGICSANCLNPQTLHQMPKAKRKRLYDLITTNLKNKRTGIRLAQDMERKLESYRKKRKKGFFGWFKRNPSRSEQLETLRLESELREAYIKEVGKTWKRTRNLKKVKALLTQAVTQLEPDVLVERRDRQSDRASRHTSAQTARRQSALAEEIAVSAGLPREVAEDAAKSVGRTDRRESTPRVDVSSAVREASARLSEARAAPIPDAPPMPPEGIDAYLARQRQEGPASATGTLATSAASANSVPQYDAARTSRPALTAALQDQIKAGKQLRKVSPTSSKQRQEGRGALLDAIRKGKELRKTQGPNANRAKSTNPLFARILARRGAIEGSPDGEEESWHDDE